MDQHRDTPTDGRIELAPGVRLPPSELVFAFSSSSGPGGQNVNKRATKAELRIRIAAIPLAARARERLVLLAGRRLNDGGEIVIVADDHRSQGQNRSECLERLRELLVEAMAVPRTRRKTRPSRGSVERRLAEKNLRSRRKQARRGGDSE
jgi:ribosome-associated protein